MLRSKLFLKTFSALIVGVLLITAAGYLVSVPWLRATVEEQEEATGRVVLNNITEMVQNAYEDIESWRESALEARRRELRHILEVAEASLDRLEKAYAAGGLPPAEAEQRILEDIRDFRYGSNDYIFVANYDSRLISHPDPELHGADYSDVRGAQGNLIVPPMVQGARENGEGFHTYWWRRLGEEEPAEKLSYYKHLPDRDWVIGTGLYVDDLEKEVAERKAEVTERLRSHLHETRIADTGYVYVFDSDLNMLIHPNDNIEGTNFSDMLNPVTGNPIGKELMEAAETQERKLVYKWDKPSDPGNYVYDKISWVRYLPGPDWYIASSVYVNEFRETANNLTWRLLLGAALALAIAIPAAYFFLRRLTTPIARLADSASRVGEGDLSAKTDIQRDDEIGVLASTFNTMVDRLKDQIDNMEHRVAERTAELDRTVQDLENRNRASAEINRMGELLQSCQSEAEIFTVATRTLKALFPRHSGRTYVMDADGGLDLVSQWGTAAPVDYMADSAECWAIRRGKTQTDPSGCSDSLCPQCCEPGVTSLCVPLVAESTVFGVIKLNQEGEGADPASAREAQEPLLATVAEHLALSVTNLRLRERLQQQSIKDPLTGLANRRRLEEALGHEIGRAQRHGEQVGVLMLDVDHFKRFNDTYGHDTGDAVLQEVGKVLTDQLRGEDMASRFGGEEFTLVAPQTDRAGLQALAEKIRVRIAERVASALALPANEDGPVTVTLSVGAALYPQDGEDVHSLLKAADDALYRAKEAGRNRVMEAG